MSGETETPSRFLAPPPAFETVAVPGNAADVLPAERAAVTAEWHSSPSHAPAETASPRSQPPRAPSPTFSTAQLLPLDEQLALLRRRMPSPPSLPPALLSLAGAGDVATAPTARAGRGTITGGAQAPETTTAGGAASSVHASWLSPARSTSPTAVSASASPLSPTSAAMCPPPPPPAPTQPSSPRWHPIRRVPPAQPPPPPPHYSLGQPPITNPPLPSPVTRGRSAAAAPLSPTSTVRSPEVADEAGAGNCPSAPPTPPTQPLPSPRGVRALARPDTGAAAAMVGLPTPSGFAKPRPPPSPPHDTPPAPSVFSATAAEAEAARRRGGLAPSSSGALSEPGAASMLYPQTPRLPSSPSRRAPPPPPLAMPPVATTASPQPRPPPAALPPQPEHLRSLGTPPAAADIAAAHSTEAQEPPQPQRYPSAFMAPSPRRATEPTRPPVRRQPPPPPSSPPPPPPPSAQDSRAASPARLPGTTPSATTDTRASHIRHDVMAGTNNAATTSHCAASLPASSQGAGRSPGSHDDGVQADASVESVSLCEDDAVSAGHPDNRDGADDNESGAWEQSLPGTANADVRPCASGEPSLPHTHGRRGSRLLSPDDQIADDSPQHTPYLPAAARASDRSGGGKDSNCFGSAEGRRASLRSSPPQQLFRPVARRGVLPPAPESVAGGVGEAAGTHPDGGVDVVASSPTRVTLPPPPLLLDMPAPAGVPRRYSAFPRTSEPRWRAEELAAAPKTAPAPSTAAPLGEWASPARAATSATRENQDEGETAASGAATACMAPGAETEMEGAGTDEDGEEGDRQAATPRTELSEGERQTPASPSPEPALPVCTPPYHPADAVRATSPSAPGGGDMNAACGAVLEARATVGSLATATTTVTLIAATATTIRASSPTPDEASALPEDASWAESDESTPVPPAFAGPHLPAATASPAARTPAVAVTLPSVPPPPFTHPALATTASLPSRSAALSDVGRPTTSVAVAAAAVTTSTSSGCPAVSPSGHMDPSLCPLPAFPQDRCNAPSLSRLLTATSQFLEARAQLSPAPLPSEVVMPPSLPGFGPAPAAASAGCTAETLARQPCPGTASAAVTVPPPQLRATATFVPTTPPLTRRAFDPRSPAHIGAVAVDADGAVAAAPPSMHSRPPSAAAAMPPSPTQLPEQPLPPPPPPAAMRVVDSTALSTAAATASANSTASDAAGVAEVMLLPSEPPLRAPSPPAPFVRPIEPVAADAPADETSSRESTPPLRRGRVRRRICCSPAVEAPTRPPASLPQPPPSAAVDAMSAPARTGHLRRGTVAPSPAPTPTPVSTAAGVATSPPDGEALSSHATGEASSYDDEPPNAARAHTVTGLSLGQQPRSLRQQQRPLPVASSPGGNTHAGAGVARQTVRTSPRGAPALATDAAIEALADSLARRYAPLSAGDNTSVARSHRGESRLGDSRISGSEVVIHGDGDSDGDNAGSAAPSEQNASTSDQFDDSGPFAVCTPSHDRAAASPARSRSATRAGGPPRRVAPTAEPHDVPVPAPAPPALMPSPVAPRGRLAGAGSGGDNIERQPLVVEEVVVAGEKDEAAAMRGRSGYSPEAAAARALAAVSPWVARIVPPPREPAPAIWSGRVTPTAAAAPSARIRGSEEFFISKLLHLWVDGGSRQRGGRGGDIVGTPKNTNRKQYSDHCVFHVLLAACAHIYA